MGEVVGSNDTHKTVGNSHLMVCRIKNCNLSGYVQNSNNLVKHYASHKFGSYSALAAYVTIELNNQAEKETEFTYDNYEKELIETLEKL